MELQLNLKGDGSIRIEERYRTGTSQVLIELIKGLELKENIQRVSQGYIKAFQMLNRMRNGSDNVCKPGMGRNDIENSCRPVFG